MSGDCFWFIVISLLLIFLGFGLSQIFSLVAGVFITVGMFLFVIVSFLCRFKYREWWDKNIGNRSDQGR
jgi:hypothetical protein